MSDSSRYGRFVWYDLMTSAPDEAITFYSKLIGWDTQEWEGEMPYTMWVNKGNPLGGVAELPEAARAAGAPPHWLAYIKVEDVAAMSERVTQLGGAILHPATDIPNAGCFAVLADPQSAVFAIYASNEESPQKEKETIGEFSWHELAAAEYAGAFDFYQELFGWGKMEEIDMGGGAGIYQLYGMGEQQFGGMFTKTDEMPGPPMWLYYITVDDVHTSLETVKELGGKVVNGPIEVPGGEFIAQCFDPQGAFFALHSKP